MSRGRQGLLQGRRLLSAFVGFAIVAALVAVFTGTLTRSTDVETRAEVARAEVAVLEARVAEGAREIAFLDEPAFIQQMARTIGFGEEGERSFALPADAPPPEAIVLVGPKRPAGHDRAPFEAWMELLFGA